MSLTLDEARAVSDRVREHAAGIGATVTVAIVDGGGHLQVLDRMDGASPMSARVAPAKASGVALFRRDGGDLMGLQQAYPAVFAQKCFTVEFQDGRKLIATPAGEPPEPSAPRRSDH